MTRTNSYKTQTAMTEQLYLITNS